MGQMGGVRRLAQGNYEKGERVPDAVYLTAIAEAGADVGFILTGRHSPSVSGLNEKQERESFTNRSALTGLIDVDRMARIVEMLEGVASQAGRTWPPRLLLRKAVEVYNFLEEEAGDVDDNKMERVMRLVVNQ